MTEKVFLQVILRFIFAAEVSILLENGKMMGPYTSNN